VSFVYSLFLKEVTCNNKESNYQDDKEKKGDEVGTEYPIS